MRLEELLITRAAQHGNEEAAIVGQTPYSYAEVLGRVLKLRNALAAVGDPGDRVGIVADNCIEYIDALYGAPAAGRVLTVVNQRLHPMEWAEIARDAELKLAIVGAAYIEAFRTVADRIPSLEAVVVLGHDDIATGNETSYSQFLEGNQEPPREEPKADTDIAWAVYTSGSTGLPKGVLHTHRGLILGSLTVILANGPRHRDRPLHTMPLCHIGALGIMVTHLQSGCHVLRDRFEAETFHRDVEELRITSATLMPTMMRMIFDSGDSRKYDLSSLAHVGFGGPMPQDLLRTAIEIYGPTLATGYGMTEIPGTICLLSKEDVARAAKEAPELLASCGTPEMLCDVRVVDEESRECADGEVGEITVKADHRFAGYLNSELDPQDASQPFRTGDLAYRDPEAHLFIVDRKKDMIKSGGESIYSAEIERVLEQCPGIREVAVVGLPDDLWVEAVSAVVVPEPGATLTDESVTEWSRAHLASYKCPKRVYMRETLPRSSLGKVLKQTLRDELVNESVN